MRRPATAILLLLVIVQAVLSPLAGAGIAVCLGCGHDEGGHVAPVETCSHGCSHGAELLVVLDDETHDGCCTDVEIDVSDLPDLLRIDAAPAAALPALPMSIAVEPASTVPSMGMPAAARLDDPGGRRRLLVLRTTRLLI